MSEKYSLKKRTLHSVALFQKVSNVTNRLRDMQTIWFSLNLNDCVQGCLMQNFRVVASRLSDFSNFLSEKGREKGRKKERKEERKEVKDPRCRAPHLPKGQRRS